MPTFKKVIDHTGNIIASEHDLPDSVARWTAGRKEDVVKSVQAGIVSLQWIWDRYQISNAEFTEWSIALAANGQRALRVTHR